MIRSYRLLFLYILFLFLTKLYGQDGVAQSVLFSSSNLKVVISHELIYLETDRMVYKPGDTLWFKVSMVDGLISKPSLKNEIVYIEILDLEKRILIRKRFRLYNGTVCGEFKLPNGFSQGKYLIRSYTNYMRNYGENLFFKKFIFLSTNGGLVNPEMNLSENINIEFFPEGGSLVASRVNKVAFKSNKNKFVGQVFNSSGEKVLEFNSSIFGNGYFLFEPKPFEFYYALVQYEDDVVKFKLPKVASKGVLLIVKENKNSFKVVLQSTLEEGLEGYKLIGVQKSGLKYSSGIKGAGPSAIISVPKRSFQFGIIQFLLLNKDDELVSERLKFIDDKEDFYPEKNRIFGVGDTINLKELLVGKIPDLSQTNVSLSVAKKEEFTRIRNYNFDVITYFKLISELDGDIQSPAYYLNSGDIAREKNLDLLMLTSKLRGVPERRSIYFKPETGITISGRVLNSFDQAPVKAEVKLLYKNKLELGGDVKLTDNQGSFSFIDLNLNGRTHVFLEAKSLEGKREYGEGNNINDEVIHIELEEEVISDLSNKSIIDRGQRYDHKRGLISEDSLNQSSYHNDAIVLEEVTVASKLKKENNKMISLYKEPSHRLDFNKNIMVIGDNLSEFIQTQIPGIRIVGESFVVRGTNSLSGSSEPLLLIDGIPVGNKNIRALLNSLIVSDIDFIDFVKGPRATIYGSKAANGIIAVYTKNGDSKAKTKKQSNHIAYKQFIHPGYSTTDVSKIKLSEGLITKQKRCWIPYLSVNTNNYFIPKEKGFYEVVIEGISSGGELIYEKYNFNVSQ